MDFETFRRQRHGEVTSVVPLEQNVEKGQPEPPRRRRRKRPKQQSRNEKPFYRKRGTYAWLAVVIVGLLLLLALAPISFGSVKVEGLQVLSQDEIFRVAKISRPINVVQLATADISRRLNGDLRIASAKVDREFPATIRIQVEERRPIAVVATEFG
ncbi:MAG: FtsQ-type POTRA domain-containing protein, partial [Negativicoccus succinicivorans]|nr:FtsQ-type POTRA domain-containing protein [Negativicoccus succinicivorans]